MCHMIADTEAELHAMADSIGVARKWYQGNHYDVCKAKRELAISLGATPVSQRDLVRILIDHRRAANESSTTLAEDRCLKR